VTSEAAKKAWATRRKQGWVSKKKRAVLPGVIVGFYKDEEGKTRPVTKSRGELKRRKIVEHPKKFKGVAPRPAKRRHEWRIKHEIKRLSDVQRDIVKYEDKLRDLKPSDDRKAVEDLLEMLRNTEARLLWMKKHTFIEAGYDGTGRKNYEKAIEKGIDYGFDLKNPANSFINTFHLKKHDVKGLRIYLELKPIKLDLPGEERARKHGYTTRAYYKNGVMHLPPSRRDEKPDKVEHNVIHEIGLAQKTHAGNIIYLLEEGVEFPSNIRPKVWESFNQDNMENVFVYIVKELRAFDRLCKAQGTTRYQILRELVLDHMFSFVARD